QEKRQAQADAANARRAALQAAREQRRQERQERGAARAKAQAEAQSESTELAAAAMNETRGGGVRAGVSQVEGKAGGPLDKENPIPSPPSGKGQQGAISAPTPVIASTSKVANKASTPTSDAAIPVVGSWVPPPLGPLPTPPPRSADSPDSPSIGFMSPIIQFGDMVGDDSDGTVG
ncbi:unnamed protein product, partial [Discosporangium mesarthrocarpum]